MFRNKNVSQKGRAKAKGKARMIDSKKDARGAGFNDIRKRVVSDRKIQEVR